MLNTQQPGDGGSRMGFPDWLTRVCGRSRATAEAYARDTAAYMDWAAGQGLTAAQALNRAQLGLYLMERMQPKRRWAGEERQLGARSAARVVSALRIYQSWLRFNGELEGAEGFDPEPPKYSRRLPDYHNTDEMQALVCAWEGERGPLALRNSAMLHLLYATGIRASELCGLNLGDVEPRARLLRVRGKGNRERVVPYGARAAEALERWLELRHLLSHNGPDRQEAEGRRQGDQGPEGSSDFSLTTGGRGPASSGFQSPVSNERGAMSNEPGATARPGHSALNPDPSTGPGSPVPGPSDRPADALFLNHRGGRLTRRGLHDVVDRSALRAGIVKSVSTHKLRHACATHLLEGGADVRLVQELLGHQSLATTQVYTAVTRTQLLDAFDRAHPRAKK